MEKITVEKDRVVVRVDTRFYPYSSILKTAKKFSDSCWVLVDGDPENTIIVILKPKTGDISLNEIGYEFYNHLIAAIKNG